MAEHVWSKKDKAGNETAFAVIDLPPHPDSARLDWLERDGSAVERIEGTLVRGQYASLREAIDADMAGG